MLYIRLKNILILLFIGLGVWLNLQFDINVAWPLYVAALILILTNYLFGTVGVAFRKLKSGKVKEAETILKMTKYPNMLVKTHKAYYHFTKGMIALQHKKVGIGQSELLKTMDMGLRTKNDEALVALNLAHTFFMQNAHKDARKYLDVAISCNSNDLMIKENISVLDKKLVALNF